MKRAQRNHTVDLLRLIASIMVIFLHVNFNIRNEELSVIIKLICRTAVPLFFSISGYFIASKLTKLDETKIKVSIVKLIKIYMLACLIYYPLSYYQYGTYFKLSYIINGTYAHLWFLMSLIIGIIVHYILRLLGVKEVLINYISLLVLLFILATDSYANIIPGFNTNPIASSHKRILISFPFIQLGLVVNNVKERLITKKAQLIGITLILGGEFIQYLEVVALKEINYYPPLSHELLIGTVLITIGLMIVSLSVNTSKNKISTWGESYSLFIYLYHYIIYKIIQINLENYYKIDIPFFYPITIFIITISIGAMLKRFSPKIFNFLLANN